jgi:hypothetical protein
MPRRPSLELGPEGRSPLRLRYSIVMRGLDPRIHAPWPSMPGFSMDCRIKSGNDDRIF